MTEWVRREDDRRGDSAHGIRFVMFERATPNSRGGAEVGPRKAFVDGSVALTLALGQRKYGDELIAQVYARSFRVEDRVADAWNRIQVYLGPADAQTAAMLERLAAEIRERLR